AGAAAVLLGVAAGLVLQRAPGRPAAPIQVAADRPGAAAGVADTAGPDAELIEGDVTWLLVADAGADVDWDGVSAAGLGPAPGSAVGAVAGLTEAERTELARLLEIVLAGEPL
ncbi:MAG: hypothetical protein IMZ67_02110, partial [Acidobacteria bacterium]|nr:hypothetical protein [Acidobacteriota bacterium]